MPILIAAAFPCDSGDIHAKAIRSGPAQSGCRM